MLYQNKTFDTMENVLHYIADQAEDEAMRNSHAYGDDFSEAIELSERCIHEAINEFDKTRTAITLDTIKGPVEGWFVGQVQYAVGGDAETGWETDMSPAFKDKKGRVFMACELDSKNENGNKKYRLFNPRKLGGIIHWDTYPIDWPAEKTRPFSVSAPKPLPLPNELQIKDFVDIPWRTDLRDFLYVIKPKLDDLIGKPEYEGHSRVRAAHEMRKIRNYGFDVDVTVYPIHRQEEYEALPF